MPRPKIKEELLTAANENYIKLKSIISSLPADKMNASFSFSVETKKEAHWKRDKNVRDVLMHIYAWHTLLLDFVKANVKGEKRAFLLKGYTWKSYSLMNVEFNKLYQKTTFEDAIKLLDASHHDVLESIQEFSNEELFTKKKYDWVGTSTLGSYYISSTSSHYEWALKKIKLHVKSL